MESRYGRYRPDFFWPIALITVGVVWLLVNSHVVASENVMRLIPLWPVLIIGAGVSLLLRRIWWPLSGILWLAVAAFIVWALVAAPGVLPRVDSTELKHFSLREPAGTAKSADVQLDLSINETKIHPLSGSGDLLTADLYAVNDVKLDSSGGDTRNVHLRSEITPNNFFWNFNWIGQTSKTWDIGLSPDMPIRLVINAATGHTSVDLTGTKVASLDLDAGTGSTDIRLPVGQANFPLKTNMGTGSMNIQVPSGSGTTMDINGGTGSLTINLPSDAGVRVDVRNSGLGSLSLPPTITRVGGGEGKEGIYESAKFTSAKSTCIITLDIGTGSVTIHQ